MDKIRELQKIKEKEDMAEYTFKPNILKTAKKIKNPDLKVDEVEQDHGSKPISNYVDDGEFTNTTNLRNSQQYVMDLDEQLKARFAPKHQYKV